MKWVICNFCKAEYPVSDEENVSEWGSCELCGHKDWLDQEPISQGMEKKIEEITEDKK